MYYIVQVELIVWGSQQHLYTFKWISGQMQPTLVVFFGIKVPSYQEKTSTDTFSHLRLLEKFFHLRLVNEEITCDHRAEQRTNNSDYWNFSKFSINFIFLVIITMSTHFNRVYCPHEQQQLETISWKIMWNHLKDWDIFTFTEAKDNDNHMTTVLVQYQCEISTAYFWLFTIIVHKVTLHAVKLSKREKKEKNKKNLTKRRKKTTKIEQKFRLQ